MTLAQPTLARMLGTWSPEPVTIAVLAGAAALYCAGAARSRRRSRWRAASFLTGLLVLAVASMSGIDTYSARLLSVHMVAHLLIALVAPALLLAGAPAGVALSSLRGGARAALARVLSNGAVRALAAPRTGFALFALALLGTHVPSVHELTLRDASAHALEHAVYLATGLLFLAPLIGADPLPHRPGAIARFCWLLAATAVMAIPGALLAFASGVRYPAYIAPARALGRSALADEHRAGAIMWVGGGLALFSLAMLLAFAALRAEEQRERRREAHASRREPAPRTAGALGR